ncbi:MAG TPA: DUF58 domain-containing protein [Mycobacteriales bacterium]|nr:DUF58 domain-containing protein [Mycobacteriales bacterium]
MRAALAGLTLRGRCFLAAGAAASISALVLGERDLLRVGVLLLALPIVAAGAVSRTRYRLACTRRLDPGRVPAGSPATVVLRVDNLSRIPTGLLLVEDSLPYVLGGRPRFILDRLGTHGVREVTYQLRTDIRGRYRIGPLVIRLTDPFGMTEVTRAFTAVDSLVVTPAVCELPPVRLGGGWSGGGEAHARAVATTGEDDVATREYRNGDDLRRVHWRATARYGELMVRREEQPWQSRGLVLLDGRSGAHRGDGPGSSFESSVAAVASIGIHLARSGYAVRVLTELGAEVTSPGLSATDLEAGLLDSLAVVKPSGLGRLDRALAVVRQSQAEGVVVAVLGTLSPADAESLVRARRGGMIGVAVLLDTASWAGPPNPVNDGAFAAAQRTLAVGGWRVVPMRRGTSLRDTWVGAGLDARRRSREPGSPWLTAVPR